jgi:hypothetical protein
MIDGLWRPDPDRVRVQAGQVLFGGLMVVGVLTATVALLLIWMFLTDPVELARSVRQGTTLDLARVFASAVYDLVSRLLTWV